MKPIRAVASDRYEPIDSLRNMLDNPRKPLSSARAAELDESLLSLGLFRPLLVWRGESGDAEPVVIGGNQRLGRLRVLLERGHTLERPGVPVTTYEGSEPEARLVALRDNNSDGDWDWDALASYTDDLDRRLAALSDDLPLTMGLSGFETSVLEDLAVSLGTPPPSTPHSGPGKKKGKSKSERRLSDDSGLVTVAIGHVRGKLETATYKRLVAALAVEADREAGAGLDAAFKRLLDRAGVASDLGRDS